MLQKTATTGRQPVAFDFNVNLYYHVFVLFSFWPGLMPIQQVLKDLIQHETWVKNVRVVNPDTTNC